MGLENKLGDDGFVVTSLESMVNWSRADSVWPLLFGLAAVRSSHCDRRGKARYRPLRLGAFRASPRQANLMIVSGPSATRWRR